jgi:hypothetical protein
MRIISPTKLQKKKLKEMILNLFPKYKYVQINKNGIILLRKSFWWYLLLIADKVDITEMCAVSIPEKLEKLKSKTHNEDEYVSAYNPYSYAVLDLMHHRMNVVIDYLYNEYVNIKYNIQRVYYTKNNLLPQTTYSLSQILTDKVKEHSLVLSRLSTLYVKSILKKWKDGVNVLNHPVLRRSYLNYWFNRNFKEELYRIYNIKIVYT